MHVVRPDGAVLPSALLIARLPTPPIGDATLLVQVSDISARERAQSIANCVAAVRQVIVSSSAVDAAMPQLLEAFSGYLGWSVAQYWAMDSETHTMRVRNAWNTGGPILEGFLHASRGMSAQETQLQIAAGSFLQRVHRNHVRPDSQ